MHSCVIHFHGLSEDLLCMDFKIFFAPKINLSYNFNSLQKNFKIYFFYIGLEIRDEAPPSSGSLPKYLQKPRLSQHEAEAISESLSEREAPE